MRLVALVVALFGSGCFSSCQPPVLQQGTCAASGAPPVATLELGSDADPFAPLADGDVIMRRIGGQGATMIIVRLRVSGPSAPACLAQSTAVTSPDAPGLQVADSNVSLATTLELDGTRTTPQLLLPGYYPSSVRGVVVTTQAGGLTVTRSLSVDEPGYFDFAPAADLPAPVDDLAAAD